MFFRRLLSNWLQERKDYLIERSLIIHSHIRHHVMLRMQLELELARYQYYKPCPEGFVTSIRVLSNKKYTTI